ncbi:hypothetical protein Cgig2_020227 [Carnegiea gigantea]|uniref:Uncharacterized protein n=1 Tax=Carnegiea gigantea TaxID=171969 RepID=A0A9Q1KVD1_9CARY|nr:hypothetical protein Cgig2_020227 [Carnegiea gigantea]
MDEILMQIMFDGYPGVNEVAAMFKIGNMKELPTILDHLSEEGKEFMSNAAPPERSVPAPELVDAPTCIGKKIRTGMVIVSSTQHILVCVCDWSPQLHPRSPDHLDGVMSPISSPRATFGASTPLTGASGAIPFYLSWQSTCVQEGFGVIPKSSHGAFLNRACYHDTNRSIHQGIQSGSRASTSLFGSEME